MIKTTVEDLKKSISKMDKACFKASQEAAIKVMSDMCDSVDDDDKEMRTAKRSGAMIAAIEFLEMCEASNVIAVIED
jgi:hypothetical protein